MPNIELKIEVDSKGAITNINSTGTAFDKLQKETDQSTASLQKNQKTTDTSTKSLYDMAKAAGALFVAWQGVRFFSESIQEATDSTRSLQMLQNALDGAGGAYGRTAEDLRAYAGVMQETFNVQNEVAESIQRTLIQQRLQPELLDRVTRATLAVNRSMGDGIVTEQEATETAKKLALALEHPDVALRGLREAGIVFSKDQKKVIDEMLKTGDAAKIQETILRELEKRYGSTEITGFIDAQQKLALAIADIKEAFGTGLIEGFEASGLLKSISDSIGSKALQDAFYELGKSVSTIASNIILALKYISDLTGGIQNLTVATVAFFAAWKLQSIQTGILSLSTAISATATSTLSLSSAATAAGTALRGMVLPAILSGVLLLNEALKDLSKAYDDLEVAERNTFDNQKKILDFFKSFRDEYQLSSQQMKKFHEDFASIADPAQRVLAIMDAITAGKYGQKMANDLITWGAAWNAARKETTKANDAVSDFGDTVKKVNPFIAEYQQQLGFSSLSASDLSQKLGALVTVYNSHREQILTSGTATEKLKTAAAELTKEYESQKVKIPVALQNISDATVKATESQKRYKESIDATFYSVFGGKDAFNTLIKQMNAAKKEQDDLKEATEEYRKSLGILNTDDLKLLQTRTAALVDLFSKFKSQIMSDRDSIRSLGVSVSELIKGFKMAGEEIPNELLDIQSEIDEARKGFLQFLNIVGQLNPAFSAMMPAIEMMDEGMQETTTTTKETTTNLEELIQTTNTAISALEKMGLISSQTAGIISGMVGGVSTLSSSIKAWKAAGTGFTGTLEKISAGIGIVTGAITVLGAVFKLFKGPSGELKALRRDLGDLSGLTKDWTKELEKAAKAIGGLGSAGRAVNNVFDEMVRTSNITLQNFNQWSERLRNIFSGFTQGFAGANETATNFGKGFDALIEKAKQLGIEGGKATTGWILMFEDMKKQGVFVQEIFDYIQKSSQAGLAGYKQMLESISTTDIESEIAKLKESMMGVVVPIDNAAQLLQLSELEAKLKEAQKLQAVFGNASIQLYDDMLAYEKKVSENQTLVNAVKGWGLAMTNFTNVFRVESQGQFDEYQATLKNQVDALKAAGFTDAEIFQMMQDQLSRINLISNDFGWILDDGTKAILEQAKALGYVTDNQTKIKTQQQTMGEGFKMVTDAVFLLVETLGGTVPEAMKKASQEVLNFQDAASNTPAMVFDAVVQDDVMSTVQSDLEKTARIAATTATSMENDFMSFRSQVEAVNQSIIELKANLESMQSMSISAGYNESPLSPVPVSRMSEPSGRRTLDINIKMSGEASGKSQSDIANKLIGYFEKLGNKNKTDYDIVRDLKRIVNNNVDGFRSFLSGELNG